MSYCPKCGAKVKEEMNFCPKCGTTLKAVEPQAQAPAQPAPPAPIRVEKEEKREKQEKQEKEEREHRYEKRESSFMGPLIGGLVLIFLGFVLFLVVTGSLQWQAVGALFFIVLGIIVIIGAAYAATVARRRHPST